MATELTVLTRRDVNDSVASCGQERVDDVFSFSEDVLTTADALAKLAALGIVPVSAPLFSMKTEDQSVTESETLVDCSGLSLAVAANAKYRVELGLIGTENGGQLMGQVVVPSGAVAFGKWEVANAVEPVKTIADVTELASLFSACVGATYSLTQPFIVTTGSTPGDIVFQFAQTTSDLAASTIKAGSWIKADRVA